MVGVEEYCGSLLEYFMMGCVEGDSSLLSSVDYELRPATQSRLRIGRWIVVATDPGSVLPIRVQKRHRCDMLRRRQ